MAQDDILNVRDCLNAANDASTTGSIKNFLVSSML